MERRIRKRINKLMVFSMKPGNAQNAFTLQMETLAKQEQQLRMERQNLEIHFGRLLEHTKPVHDDKD